MTRKMYLGCLMFGLILVAGPALGQGVSRDLPKDLSFTVAEAGEMIALADGCTACKAGEKKAEKKPAKPNWGGFGGVLGNYMFLDLSKLDPMTKDRGMENFDDSLITYGGVGGLIYKDFRLGGFGFGGRNFTDDKVNDERLTADLVVGGGGLLLELNHGFSKRFGVQLGSLLGVISAEVRATGSDLGPDEEWSDHATTWMAYPYAGFWFAPTDYFWVQLNGGYNVFRLETEDFENEDLDMDMTDGDLTGNWQASINLLFGYNPVK